jgi:hypothetical protein
VVTGSPEKQLKADNLLLTVQDWLTANKIVKTVFLFHTTPVKCMICTNDGGS